MRNNFAVRCFSEKVREGLKISKISRRNDNFFVVVEIVHGKSPRGIYSRRRVPARIIARETRLCRGIYSHRRFLARFARETRYNPRYGLVEDSVQGGKRVCSTLLDLYSLLVQKFYS